MTVLSFSSCSFSVTAPAAGSCVASSGPSHARWCGPSCRALPRRHRIQVLRLNKLLRGELFEIYEDAKAGSSQTRFALRIVRILLMMLLAFHIVGCAWHFIAIASDPPESFDNDEDDDDGALDANWVSAYFGKHLTDVPNQTRYLASVR